MMNRIFTFLILSLFSTLVFAADIKIDTRKVTALKGVTGVRKTTLIRALLRYYPSNTDNILVF